MLKNAKVARYVWFRVRLKLLKWQKRLTAKAIITLILQMPNNVRAAQIALLFVPME